MDDFRALVKSAEKSTRALDKRSEAAHDWLRDLYDRYGLRSDGHSWTLNVVTDHLNRKIGQALHATERGWTQREIGLLTRQLIFEHVVDGRELEPSLSVLHTIRDAVRNRLPIVPFENSEQWKGAVQTACESLKLQFSAKFEPLMKKLYARAFVIADAIKFLRSADFEIRFEEGQITADEAELRRVAERIIRGVKTLGGRDLAAHLISQSAHLFDPLQQRYHFVRYLPSSQIENPGRSLPVGYLFNLCAAYPEAPTLRLSETSRRDLIREIEELSIALTALLDVQPYSIFEQLFHGPETILQFLRERVVFDATFSLIQMRPTDVVRIIGGLLDWVDEKRMRDRWGWSLKEGLSVVDAIIQRYGSVRGPTLIEEEDIAKIVEDLPTWKLEKILSALTHEGSVNQGYELPQDIERLTFGLRPLLRISKHTQLLMDISWCAPSFIEAIVAAAESVGFKDFDGKRCRKVRKNCSSASRRT
jgi:hypothetical protein